MTGATSLPAVPLGPVSRAALATYLELSGDENPVHVDAALAAAAGLADTPVPGLMAMALIEPAARQWFGTDAIVDLHLTFTAPVFPDLPLVAEARPVGSEGELHSFRVLLHAGGRIVAMGVATVAGAAAGTASQGPGASR
ncbi:MAG TPA: MaoC family dehydratase [Hyphomicrobiales bacterium]|nr:MaoC family dehydratase [Hyphomicrobiales bacterium]